MKQKFPEDFLKRSLYDAVNFYCEKFDPSHKDMMLDEAIEKYLKNPKLTRTTKDHRNQSKWKLENFSQAFGNRLVGDFTADEIEEYIYDENKEWVDKTRANHYSIFHTFFNFLFEEGLG